ncbi:MAG: fumarylacetoacetate hydrolase family protein [Acidobacteria bacterium]|nr:fumarylacetoacetate hydrolase family protein [Acidobacteriota bacterium]
MRLARFEHSGIAEWGFVEDSEVFPMPAGSVSLLDALSLSSVDLGSLREEAGDPVGLGLVRLLAPIPHPPQFVGVGLNYKDHAAEAGLDIPESPVTFGFLCSAVINPGDPIEIPPFTKEVDWEVELGIVIGAGGRDIPESEAISRVAGYVLINDVSARDIQMGDGQWSRAKSFDTFKPMGPWVTTTDELGAASDLAIMLWVNDELKQSSTTSQLVFDVPYLVSFLSRSTTLRTGAIISTGTPFGVGFARDPQEYLQPGDTVTMEIEGIGRITNPVVAAGS